MQLQSIVKSARDKLRNLEPADVLARVGLQLVRHKSLIARVLPTAGLVAAGFVAGVGAGLLFAPKAGKEAQKDIAGWVKSMLPPGGDVPAEGADAGDTNGKRKPSKVNAAALREHA